MENDQKPNLKFAPVGAKENLRDRVPEGDYAAVLATIAQMPPTDFRDVMGDYFPPETDPKADESN